MKPKALIYTSTQEVEESLRKFLEDLDITVCKSDAIPSSINYFFAVVNDKEDLSRITELLKLDAKKIIALPDKFDRPAIDAKYVYYHELLTSNLDHTKGYANWLAASLKTQGSVYLPKEDMPIYPVTLTELLRFMTREAFTYYQPGEVFVYHPTSLHKFADWLAQGNPNLMVNVDPSFHFMKLDIDISKHKNSYLPLSGHTLKELFEKSIVQQANTQIVAQPKKKKNIKKTHPKLPKVKVRLPRFKNSGNVARLSTLTILVLGMPIYLFLASLGFLYLGSKAINISNTKLANFSFEMSGTLAKTNSQVLGIASINNDLLDSSLAQIDASRIGKKAASEDYESLYKELAFSEVSSSNEPGLFSKLVNLVEVIPGSRQKILAISRTQTIKDQLLGKEEKINYLVVTLRNNLAEEARVLTIEDSQKTYDVSYEPHKIDENIKGVVDVPEDILDYLETESFEFKYVGIGSDFSENARMASWFLGKAYEEDIDIVVFVYEHQFDIPEDLSEINLETIFYGFREGSIKAWSKDSLINSVLLDLNKLTAV